jgi:Raf kinase inhibitor-like YbhB/YbcL family protein
MIGSTDSTATLSSTEAIQMMISSFQSLPTQGLMTMSFLFLTPKPAANGVRHFPLRLPAINGKSRERADQKLCLESPAFHDGESLPRIYSRGGSGLSPPLRWSGMPSEAISLALMMDARNSQQEPWLHWAIFDIPAYESGLPAGLEPSPYLSNGARHAMSRGRGSFEGIGYHAPDPSECHHLTYQFTLSALDVLLCMPAGSSGPDLRAAIKRHVVAETSLRVLPPV